MLKRFLIVAGLLALASPFWGQGAQQNQWYERLKPTGLPREVLAVLPVEIPPEGFGFPQKVLFIFVYVDDRAVNSRTRWRDVLEGYMDRGPILIWAYSQMPLVPTVSFDPLAIWFSQGEREFRPEHEDFVDLEGDFLSGVLYGGRPAAALVLLGEWLDPGKPLEVHYGDLARAVIPVVSQGEGQ